MITNKKAKRNYVDNKKFYEEILKHRIRLQEAKDKELEPPSLSNYIGECIWKIAENLSYKPCFINYSFRDEMIEDGIENCIMYFNDFNPDKTKNPFAYFTQIIYYAFLRRISREEKIRYTTYKFFHDTIITAVGIDAIVDSDDKHLIPNQVYSNISDFMDKFETREQVKKDKRKETKSLQKFYEE